MRNATIRVPTQQIPGGKLVTLNILCYGCTTQKSRWKRSKIPKTFGYEATHTFDHLVLAQEFPSAGVQGLGVWDP